MPAKNNLIKFLPFWIFLVFFKTGGGIHFILSAPLGEKLFPLWFVGLFVGAISAIQVFLDVPAGFLLDKFGYRRLLKVGTAFFLIAATLLTFELTQITYLLSFVIAAFGWLFYGPGVNAYILSHTTKNHAGRFVAFRDVFGAIGSMLSCVLLVFILLLPSQQIGLLLVILLSISLVAICLSPKDHTSVHAEQKIETHHHYIRRQYLGTLIKTIRLLNPASTMLLLLCLSGSIFYAVVWFVIPLVIAQQASTTFLGVGLGIFDFAIVLLGFLFGNLADRVNKRRMMFLGLMIFSASSLLIGFHLGWPFLLFGFLSSSGDEMAAVSLWSWLYALDKKHAHDGAVSGVLYLFQDFGWVIGPIVAGVAFSLVGAGWTIAIGALPILLTWLIAYILVPKNPCANLPAGTVPRKPLRCPHKT